MEAKRYGFKTGFPNGVFTAVGTEIFKDFGPEPLKAPMRFL
jgi:hypothetical protein